MTKIIFAKFNDAENPMILDGTTRRVLGSQKIWCEIDNEKGLIEFSIYQSEVPVEYQAKTIKMIMDEFILNSREGFMQRCYKDRQSRMLDEFIDAIKNDMVLEF